jgi:hypothetical protein
MNTRKTFVMMFFLGLAVLSLATFAWAGNTQLSLMADKNEPGASGAVTLSDKSLSIQAKGLHPNAVYTVWFVNMKPKKTEAGAGQAPFMFKTDAQGNGSYTSSLNEAPFGKWQMIMIVLHPDGDPMNMKSMLGALSTKVPEKG